HQGFVRSKGKQLVMTIQRKTGVMLEDFVAYLPDNRYIFLPTGQFWKDDGVDAAIRPVLVGKKKRILATTWLNRNSPVHYLTWAPGYPSLIKDFLLINGGWIKRKNVTTYNFYRPPNIKPGEARQVLPWLDLVRKVYSQDWQRIVSYFAHRV